MIPVLSSEAIRRADQFTIENKPIPSIDLMEDACIAFCDWYQSIFTPELTVSIVCGPGNNGGDGLGIARILNKAGIRVDVFVIDSQSNSEDFITNLQRLDIPHSTITEDKQPPIESDIIIDAIFGSGLNRDIDGLYRSVIEHINAANALRIAVDVPSGLRDSVPSHGTIVNAHFTATFQYPKLSLYMPENHPYVGDWDVLDIGLLDEGVRKEDIRYFFLESADFDDYIAARMVHSHKGDYGHVLIAGGSKGKMGAIIMASKAALRTGSGLLSNLVPTHANTIMQIAVPEGMTLTEGQDENSLSSFSNKGEYDAIGVGPGMGTSEGACTFLRQLLSKVKSPLVIDADAINILAMHPDLLPLLPPGTVLTPHPGELRRLVGDWENDFERLDKCIEFSKRWQVVMVLKGAFSAICSTDGKVYFNPSGNPGMATGGSGDVLTGMITSLLGRTGDPLKSAQAGVYLHGLAGDLAAFSLGEESMTAMDLIDHIPESLRRCEAG